MSRNYSSAAKEVIVNKLSDICKDTYITFMKNDAILSGSGGKFWFGFVLVFF